ncbi:MAG: NAD-dependent epimerase/dehydratase family protein [bacterium]|nr:NAD-dependent epimerase/dehydratase family protein [bacterium]
MGGVVIVNNPILETDLSYITSEAADEFRALAGRRVLLTGGAGFLGYYFVQSIRYFNLTADNPVRLTVLDNYIRGVPEWLAALKSDSNIAIVRHDATQPFDDGIDYDYIAHFASIASPTFYRQYPIETIDANVWGLRHLLDRFRAMCTDGKNAGLLFMSSSEIYGDPDAQNIPTSEEYRGLVSCTGPRACYDESKRFGETLCVNFARAYNVPVSIARPFNNYGPGLRLDDRRVIPDFASRILKNENIELLSDGSPTRTFCYVADAIVGYFKILVRGRAGEAYNIGVETPEISMLDLARNMASIAKEMCGYQGDVLFQVSDDPDYLKDNPNRRCPVIEKARRELGYEPSISIDEGLRRTLAWYLHQEGFNIG